MEREQKNIYLCKPCNKKFAQLNGIDKSSVSYENNLKDYSRLEFDVNRYIVIDGKKYISDGYDDLHFGMELYLEGIGVFKMQEPSIENDGTHEVKHIVSYSLEKELETYKLVDVQIHTGTTGSYEFLASANEDKTPLSDDWKWITFYNDDPELSLLDIVLEPTEGWTVGHVDDSLKDKEFQFDIDESGIYGFLTSTLCYKMRCVFTFDTENKKVNAYDIDTFGENTDIYITYRNLLNNVNVECDEDSIKTRYVVKGENDLDIRNVNYGSRYIDNIDYFKTTSYMTQKLIDKIEYWEQYKENNRSAYIDYTKLIADYEIKITELESRLPNDICDWSVIDSMDSETLSKYLNTYMEELTTMRLLVDPLPEYDENGNYIPLKMFDGTINNELYLTLLKEKDLGYYTYFEIINYIIPNIEIAFQNLSKTDDEKIDYIEEYETNWDLYGINELEAKKEQYEKCILEKYSKSWSEMTDVERSQFNDVESEYNIYHDQYLKYVGYLGDENTPGTLLYTLNNLYVEREELVGLRDETSSNREALMNEVSIKNPQFGFTEDDIKVYTALITQDTYTNENICTTSIDTTITKVDVQETLYQDACKKIWEVSQPQYTFSTDIDNLRDLEEFSCWKDSFDIGAFIRLGLRDDYSVKLRLVSISYNPCDIGSNINVEFSNMVSSKGGRNDFTYMLGDSDGSFGGSSTTGNNSSSSSTQSDINLLLQYINKSASFKNIVTSVIDENTIQSGKVASVVSDYVKAAYIESDKLKVNQAFINSLFATDITATGTISGATIIGGVFQSKNYSDNDTPPLNPDGSSNPDFVVKQGMKIDAYGDKAIYTPQIKIFGDTISNTGLISSGTINEKRGRGMYVGNFGLNNSISSSMSLAVGQNNNVGMPSEYKIVPETSYELTGSYSPASGNTRTYTMKVKYNENDIEYNKFFMDSNNFDIITVEMTYSTKEGITGDDGATQEIYVNEKIELIKETKCSKIDDLDNKTRTFTFNADKIFQDTDSIKDISFNIYIYGTISYDNCSMCVGTENIVVGNNCFAIGRGLLGDREGLTVGRYNTIENKCYFSVGIGNSDYDRKTGFAVFSDGILANNGVNIRNSSGVDANFLKFNGGGGAEICTDWNITGALAIGKIGTSSTYLRGKYVVLEANAYSGYTALAFNGTNFRPDKSGIVGLGYSGYRYTNLYLTGNVYAKGGSEALTSDQRFKHDFNDIKYAKDIVEGLDWVEFKYNEGISESDRIHSGIKAQQLEEILNKLGIDRAALVKIPLVEKRLEDCKDDEIEYAVRYTEFIPYIAQYLKEVSAEVEKLKQIINEK